MNKTAIYWFRNNQRIHDNPSLNQACEENEYLIYCFVLENRWSQNHKLGFPLLGKHREEFLKHSIWELGQKIEKAGGKLILLKGDPTKCLVQLAQSYDISKIYSSKKTGSYEIQQEDAIKSALNAKFLEDQSLFQKNYIIEKLGLQPRSFSHFRKKVEKQWPLRKLFGEAPLRPSPILNIKSKDWTPQVKPILDQAAFKGKGGEKEGLHRLHSYLWKEQAIVQYKKTRNGLIGENYSSKFSPYLAIGNLSPRKIYAEIKMFEKKHIKNNSTYWLIFELLWREYFRWVGYCYGNTLFLGESDLTGRSKQNNPKYFWEWADGRTISDFVNANMHELNETGFMSNRGRQNVASYLVHELCLPWQWGAAYFESQLIDYDVSSNWGNWQYIAGLAPDGRIHRFNISHQELRYDPKGTYRKLWS
jgi:deoxyribodipyrimidine photo-lyase